jgi:pSer/pThr/pTyr-binding forkhead associated (FHA) protein
MPPRQARLVLLGEDGENPPEDLPKYIPLDKERTTVGRSRSADLTLDSIAYPCTLSRVHVVIWRRKESEEGDIEEYSWWVTDCGSLNGTFINCTKVKEERLHDGDTLTLGGGAGLEEGERSDCLASDLVFRFESPDNIMPFATKTTSETNESSNSNNSNSALASRDPNVQRQRTEDRPKTAAVSSNNLNGSSRRSKRLNMSPGQKDDEKDDDESFDGSSSRGSNNSGVKNKSAKRQKLSRKTTVEDEAELQLNNNLKDEFKCAVCQDFFVEANTLTCGHTYCYSCIVEWFARNQRCPTCRTQCCSRPVKSNALDCAVQHIVKSNPQTAHEYATRLEKAKRSRESRRKSLESLAQRIDQAKNGGNQFLSINHEWDEDEQTTFDTGVNNYRGVAREEYCRATGLTEEFLELATLDQLQLTAKNVRLNTFGTTNEGIDATALRRRLHMFIMFG